MSTRALRARLARLPQPPAEAPRCVHHGTACRMGADWPQPDPLEAIRKHIAGPDPYSIHEHRAMTPEECAREDAHLAELVARLTARNDRIEAAMAAGDGNYSEPW